MAGKQGRREIKAIRISPRVLARYAEGASIGDLRETARETGYVHADSPYFANYLSRQSTPEGRESRRVMRKMARGGSIARSSAYRRMQKEAVSKQIITARGKLRRGPWTALETAALQAALALTPLGGRLRCAKLALSLGRGVGDVYRQTAKLRSLTDVQQGGI